MDASIAIGLVGLAVGLSSTLATLYVARRGGTFRKRSLDLQIAGQRIGDGESLSVVWGRPSEEGIAHSSLLFLLQNQGAESVDDIVITFVVPTALGAFSDGEKGKPNIELKITRGVDPGSSMKVERVGARQLIHFTLKSLHNTGVALELPLLLPAPLANLRFAVPGTFKEGTTANLLVNAHITIPIEIMLLARDRKAKHFSLELELYSPPAFGFGPLAAQWLSNIVSKGKKSGSIWKKIIYWCRAVFGFHRCLLVLSRYHEVVIRDPSKKSKNKPITALQEIPGTKRYAIGYLVSLFAFYKPLGNERN
jgi:hypothetical protein